MRVTDKRTENRTALDILLEKSVHNTHVHGHGKVER